MTATLPAMTLRDYQREAVDAIERGLEAPGTRGKVFAACGTGKTWIAAAAAVRLCPTGLVVFACPSLSLIAQVLDEWFPHVRRALAVCGDQSVPDALTHPGDLDCPVTTDEADIREWLRGGLDGGMNLIVTTYRSAEILGSALLAVRRPADLMVLDEAHHTVGPAAKLSAAVHDDDRIPAARRLYLTATPRYISAGYRGYRDDALASVSMDDEVTFGPVLYEYPFARGIADGWLDDFQVAAIGVTSAEVLEMLRALDQDAVTTIGAPPLRTAVIQTALLRARAEFGLERVIAFTPTIAQAAEFARTLPLVASLHDGEDRVPLASLAVSGQMTVSQRGLCLDQLRNPPDGGWTVVANARCLSEGVNIPAVDGVMFTHPKESTVDVIQAVSRALRRNPHGSGVATVLVPVLLPDEPDGIDASLHSDEWRTLWQVVRALRAHDSTLGAELDTTRCLSRGDGDVQPPARLLFRLPDGYDVDHVLSRVTVRLVDMTTSAWWVGYGYAQEYAAEHGHLRVPESYTTVDGFRLGQWIKDARRHYRLGWMSADRVAALERVGMVWQAHNADFEANIEVARRFRAEHGHLRVPQSYTTPDGFGLGKWLNRVRSGVVRATAERRAKLDEMGMVWDAGHAREQAGLDAARRFHAAHGHLRAPNRYVDAEGFALSRWLEKRRAAYRRGAVSEALVEQLHAMGFDWDPRDTAWTNFLAACDRYLAQHGHLDVPHLYVDDQGYTLGYRIAMHRRAGSGAGGRPHTPQQRAELDARGMIWRKRKTR